MIQPNHTQLEFIRNHPINLDRIVFFRDEGRSLVKDKKEELDLDVYCLKSSLSFWGIEYNDLAVFSYPCFNETCDMFVFDWGGMSCTQFGGELLEKFSRYLVKSAQENFNRKYVIFSEFSEYAVKDAIKELGRDKPFNIFYNMLEVRKEFDMESGREFPY